MLFGIFIRLLPKNLVSYWFGKLVSIELPNFLAQFFVSSFASYYKINLNEAEKNIADYKSIQALFTRKLKNGVRPIQANIIHPVDANISQFGDIKDHQLIQAKGKTYNLGQLLQDTDLANEFKNGYFICYYLCPTDYHRIHSPVSAKILQAKLIPGQLWPVNNWSVENIEELFCVNERVNVLLESEFGKAVCVMVGATNVGSISLAFDPYIKSNQQNRTPQRKEYQEALNVKVGDELGCFNMGSTVVMVYDENFKKHIHNIQSGPTRLGQSIQKN